MLIFKNVVFSHIWGYIVRDYVAFGIQDYFDQDNVAQDYVVRDYVFQYTVGVSF